MLSSPVSEDRVLHVTRLRSEWARTMLKAPQFAEAIQLLNEKVMQDIYALQNKASPEGAAALLKLSVKLECITDFQHELTEMIDKWQEVQEIEEQRQRRELYGNQDPYDRVGPYEGNNIQGQHVL